MSPKHLLVLAFAVGLVSPAPLADPGPTIHWPSFRGAGASGVAEATLPAEWNAETGKNILWKTPIPGMGHSSPIVWGDRIFITTSISGKKDPELKVGLYGNIDAVDDDTVHEWRVYCLDKKDGKVLWQRTAHKGVPKIQRHTKASHANSTPATDGKHLVVNFGSEGLFCYDLEGELKWKKDLGLLDAGFFRVPEAQWGYGSSPRIHDGRVIVQCDVQENSFLAAFDLETGNELWRTKRDEVPTWSTPAIYEHDGRPWIAVNGFKQIGGYDFETGELRWTMEGLGDIPVPTPVVLGDLIYFTSAHGDGAPIYAVRSSATGEISGGEHIAWNKRGMGAYMQTPLIWGDHLFVCRDNGVLTVFHASTGEKVGQRRLGTGRTGFTASAVAAAGKLYYTSEEGDVHVVRADPEAETLAVNPMGEVCMATPAISANTLYFRTQGHVVAVGAGNETD